MARHLLKIPSDFPLVVRKKYLMIHVQSLHSLFLVPLLPAEAVRKGRQRIGDFKRGERAAVCVRDTSVDDDDLAPTP